jgi:DNA repair protein RadD
MISLRPYQSAALDALHTHWNDGGGDALVVIPTGGGKSLVIASLLQQLLSAYPLMRVCVVTHSKELITQNFQELLRIWPGAPAGINSAGIGRRDTRTAILFCGVQSVWNKTEQLGRFDLILVDEAHLISRNAGTMYGKFFDAMRAAQPDLRVVGLTATPFRLDSGRLDDGDDRLFDKVVYSADVSDLIHDGFLSPLVSKGTTAEIAVKGVHKRAGDYIAGELEAAAMKGDLVSRAAAEIVRYGASRKAWLAFCTGLDHAAAVRDAIRSHGVSCETVDGTMHKKERDGIIQSFRLGHIKCLASVNVLSIGFNVPHVDLVALLRPTQSAGLYIQQVGRGLRLATGKTNCMVLDFAGNVRRHGPVDMVEGGDTGKRGKADGETKEQSEMLAKECPDCKSLVHIRVMECQDCGHVWDSKPKHEARADDAPILSGRTADGWHPVKATTYAKHVKASFGSSFAKAFNEAENTPPTLRVSYFVSGVKTVSEWLCFSHPQGSFPQRKAATFWTEAGGNLPTPHSVDEAISRQDELRQVDAVKFTKDTSGYERVSARRFTTITSSTTLSLSHNLQGVA